MKAWTVEKKELEKFYNSLKGQIPDLEKELERLINVEDEIGILVAARRSLEVIVTGLCEKEFNRPRGTELLKSIIERLNKEKKVPSFINTSMVHLNDSSTYGAHPKTFSPRQVQTVLIELLTITEWYIKHSGIEIESPAKGKQKPDPTKDKESKSELGEDEKDVNIGKKIDNYKLLDSIGEGGMGTVYMAEQTEPVKRKVALKIIKLGMDTKQVVARFEAERQALAVMDHPNIAKVYDAGATNTGRPYFVMELIRGVPITTYCDKHKLTTRERLEIFIPICLAVQHAHQKGIIHRDLKPSNILVAVQEDKPVIKIIDFGIAKAVEHRLTEQTLHTIQGQLIGTPEYMSPEQAEMTGLDIDTRTDIFSLGVILYEMLGGVLPFDPKTFQNTGLNEIQSIIREVEPPKVSTRISKLGETQTSIANRRRTDPATLQNQLKGDLDWITMKAMSKDRTQRYSSSSELAADVLRHLKNEPVLASPPSNIYLVKKYIKRHKIEVAAAIIVILAIIAGFAGTSIGMVKAKRAERTAREAEQTAIEEARTSQEVSDFLINLFEVSDPNEAKGDTITAREILDKGALKIDQGLEDQPLIQVRLMATMGDVYFNLGLFTQSEQLLERALTIRREELGYDKNLVAQGLNDLVPLYRTQGRYEEVVPLCKEAIELLESNPGTDRLELAAAYLNYGVVLMDMKEYEEARSNLEHSKNIFEEELGPDNIYVASPLFHLGWIHILNNEYEEAKPLYERSLQIREKELGNESIEVAQCLNDLGVIHQNLGRTQQDQEEFEKAESYLLRALAIQEKILGPNHPEVASALNNLGVLFWFKEEFDQVRIYWEQTLAIREEAFGHDHPEVASVLRNIGLSYQNEGNYTEAEKYYKGVILIYEKVFGPDNVQLDGVLFSLAYIYRQTGKYNDARSLYDRVLEIREATLGPENISVAFTLYSIANLSREAGNYNEARVFYERAQKIYEKEDQESSQIARFLMDFAILYAYEKDLTRADSLYQRSLSIFEKTSELENHNVIYSLAGYWAVSGNKEKAYQFLDRSIELGSSYPFYKDPLLEFLHGDPKFERMAADYKRQHGIN